MQVTSHVHAMHIDDGAASHPGGSNNYFVGDPSEEMVLIDTGEHQRRWTDAVLDFYRGLGSPKIGAVLITHGHGDHVGGLDRVLDAFGAPVRCHPKLVERLQTMLGDGDTVVPLKSRERITTGGGVTLQALFTPGHEVDHVCFYARRERVMFTGDTVLGASSTAVGDLTAYMKSLELLTRFKHDTVCPAHGPVVPPPRGRGLVRWQMEHRLERERQVVAALGKGLGSVRAIAGDIYPKNLKKGLRRTAERNVATHLEKLVSEGKVAETAASFNLKA
jgi:glyoxylase-like metal-dependent hydrolase (beta-lactamase superfamily II)